jgi:hypothetical protein
MSEMLREPLTFAVGDTLCFKRFLRDYLPINGWSLTYEIRLGNGGDNAIAFNSAPDVSNTCHVLTVTADITAGWLPGDCVLAGYAVNGAARHQIYIGELTLTPNLDTGANDVDLTTHAQRMIPLLEKALEQMALHSIQDSDIQQVEIRRAKRMDLEKQLALNKEIRRNEIAVENVRNGRPSGDRIVPQFNIVGGGWSSFNPFTPR